MDLVVGGGLREGTWGVALFTERRQSRAIFAGAAAVAVVAPTPVTSLNGGRVAWMRPRGYRAAGRKTDTLAVAAAAGGGGGGGARGFQ